MEWKVEWLLIGIYIDVYHKILGFSVFKSYLYFGCLFLPTYSIKVIKKKVDSWRYVRSLRRKGWCENVCHLSVLVVICWLTVFWRLTDDARHLSASKVLCVSMISAVVKDNANERNENLFSHCWVRLIFCKDERCLGRFAIWKAVDCNAVCGFLRRKRSSIVCRKVTFYNVSDGKIFLRKYLHTVTLCINLLKISGLCCDSGCCLLSCYWQKTSNDYDSEHRLSRCLWRYLTVGWQ